MKILGLPVKEIEMTCFACPSQWDVYLEDERELYVRYRWDWLTVSMRHDSDDTHWHAWNEVIFEKKVGDDGFGGCMDTDEMLEHTNIDLFVQKAEDQITGAAFLLGYAMGLLKGKE